MKQYYSKTYFKREVAHHEEALRGSLLLELNKLLQGFGSGHLQRATPSTQALASRRPAPPIASRACYHYAAVVFRAKTCCSTVSEGSLTAEVQAHRLGGLLLEAEVQAVHKAYGRLRPHELLKPFRGRRVEAHHRLVRVNGRPVR
eukprot:2581094-Pyramimonas_sp.AAC.2